MQEVAGLRKPGDKVGQERRPPGAALGEPALHPRPAPGCPHQASQGVQHPLPSLRACPGEGYLAVSECEVTGASQCRKGTLCSWMCMSYRPWGEDGHSHARGCLRGSLHRVPSLAVAEDHQSFSQPQVPRPGARGGAPERGRAREAASPTGRTSMKTSPTILAVISTSMMGKP